jgi:hypothetical protein
MFVWSDAWLLLSLIYSGEPADRQRLRSIGDFINHAIFTDEELDGGLARLQQAGYVSVHGHKYSASAEVFAWYTSITAGKTRTAVHKDLERVNEYLGLTAEL